MSLLYNVNMSSQTLQGSNLILLPLVKQTVVGMGVKLNYLRCTIQTILPICGASAACPFIATGPLILSPFHLIIVLEGTAL